MHDSVAFAAVLLESASVEHLDAPTTVADQAVTLQLDCGNRDALTAHAQHARNALLRDRKFAAGLAVQMLQQPAAQLRDQRVVPVACRGLRHVREQSLGVSQQRVALARALAVRPRMILLDEPFSALDTTLRENARCSVMRVLEATGMTAILVTHDRDEALTFGDTVSVLDQGRLLQAGEPRALFDDPATPEVAALLADTCFVTGDLIGDTAVTALGPVHIRHRHGARASTVRVMLRPNQFIVSRAGTPNARVRDLNWRGATSRIRIRTTDGDDLTIEVPTEGASGMTIDDLVEIRIVGTGVAYSMAAASGSASRVQPTVAVPA